MSDGNIRDERPENLRTAYKELCNSYRAIDDFRAKLLGFLPLATGGVFLLHSKRQGVRSQHLTNLRWLV